MAFLVFIKGDERTCKVFQNSGTLGEFRDGPRS